MGCKGIGEGNFGKESRKQEIEKEYLYWLCRIPGIGAVTIRRLWQQFQSFEQIYHTEGSWLAKQRFLTETAAGRLDAAKGNLPEALEEYRRLPEKGIRFVSILDGEYPGRLRNIYDFPMGLYVKGSFPKDDVPSAAIIGARGCSNYGIQVARMLAGELGRAGVQVVSGMALGIDGAGHQGVLEGEGSTFAVLGSGVDVCYPRQHWALYCQIPQRGGVISEFCLRQPARPQNFPMRNRIISGLSDVVVVVEARQKSGSLITVELGLEQGKEIFAVPGLITDELSKGCNQLIRQGAGIVTGPEDILEYFQMNTSQTLKPYGKIENGLAKKEKMVYSCLDFTPQFFDRVVEKSGLPVDEVMTLLLELEWKGYIIQPVGHYYVKRL